MTTRGGPGGREPGSAASNGATAGRASDALALAARLNEAAQQGGAVSFVYQPAGRAPSMHAVRPISATRRTLNARDLVTAQPKVFLLAHVQLMEGPATTTQPAPDGRPQPAAGPLAAAHAELLALGWHVSMAGDRLAVYRVPPQTNPMRLAAVSIFRTTSRGGGRQLRRPWSVLAPGFSRPVAFSTLDTAFEVFMRACREHAPLRPAPRDRTPSAGAR